MANVVQQSLIEQLRPVISDERIGTYLTAAGFDPDRALRLYIWNALVGEAFHLPVQSVEVALRNRVNRHLVELFGQQWWQNDTFLRLAGRERATDIETALRRIRNRGAVLDTGQIVATLSFGFWSSLLQKRYNPALWGGRLHAAFPGLPPNQTRAKLSQRVKRVADFRNRVWHHEPILKMDLLAEYSAIMELLNWLCPIKAGWVRPHCRVATLIRQKP